jgi:serine/threonine-protein kinase
MKHVSETPPSLRAYRPDAPRVLVEILERCLAKKPADRWESALQLRDTLRRAQRDGSLAAPMPSAVAPVPAAPALAWTYDFKFGHRAEDWSPRPVFEAAPAPRHAPAPPLSPSPSPVLSPVLSPALVADRVMSFRRNVKWLAASSAMGIGSLIVGVSLGEEVFIAPMLAGLVLGLGSLSVAGRNALKLRRMGVSPVAALSDGWRSAPSARDTRPHHVRLAELVDKTAGAVAQSAYGDSVRNACDDRLVIAEITNGLSVEDKALVPDVEPTADALLERIGSLASGLERLDRDLPGGARADLRARIAVLEAEPEQSPDRERRLSLLTRQLASLEDLESRRDTMRRQLDSASMALRSLRFDIVKLRTLGVNAAADVTSATQEARAVSRELGYVLDAAEESRRL